MDFRRRLYRRGSSFETTVPMPLLLTLDQSRHYDVVFAYDAEKQVWFLSFVEREALPKGSKRGVGTRRQEREE